MMGLVTLLPLTWHRLCLTLKVIIAEKIQREKLKLLYKLIQQFEYILR